MDVEGHIIEIMQETVRLPAGLKAWRTIVSDTLNDAKVFSSTPEAATQWMPIITAWVDTDKAAFSEFLGT